MAALRVRIFLSQDNDDFHLFDGGELNINSTINDVKEALHRALGETAEASEYIVGYHADDRDEIIPDTATLEEVFGNEVEVIELNAKTQSYGQRRIYSWYPQTIKLLHVENRNSFTDVNIPPKDLHTIPLNSTFWTGIDKLYVVDINNDPGVNPNRPNFQIRKYMLRAEGDIVITDNGDILIGELDVDTGNIVGEHVRMRRGDGVTKQYREEWNEGVPLYKQRIYLAHTIIQDIAAIAEIGVGIAGVVA